MDCYYAFIHEDQDISRSDECRLLFLTDAQGYTRIPICPWKPFGNTALCDTEIEVRKHRKCIGNHLQYISWSWNLRNGSELEDPGFTVDIQNNDLNAHVIECHFTDQLDERLLKDEMLSENATRSIFGWLRHSGWPKGEKEICCHSWIGCDESNVEVDDISSDDGDMNKSIEAVRVWLTEQFLTGWYSQWKEYRMNNESHVFLTRTLTDSCIPKADFLPHHYARSSISSDPSGPPPE
jgi:hypothetical protein